jgi:hypothetical protein
MWAHLEVSEWNHITYSWFWELKMTVSGQLHYMTSYYELTLWPFDDVV